ncbi:ABC transporter substrate-binding protein [Limnochorda pilosa]|uniref:ABC transporter substrate-binding protein n=1 Tax=Limnochorda pilosa TaxID=1555112 RepID=A0A0K2SGN0_LIMPI|nr:extracellular solute-binding protein [Limnochorda pilosa]BAS26268.1 ABC transporter substrate-binding protein [Limnochorda pilosa]
MSHARKRIMLAGWLAAALLAGAVWTNAGALAQGQQGSQEPVVLTVLNFLDATGPGTEREIKEIWNAFERNNPDIKIVREDLFLEPFHQKTEAYAAAGRLPDVFYMWPGGRSMTLHTQRLAKDLGPFVEPMRDEFSEAALVPQAGGYLAMIPFGLSSSHVMYVNTALLDSLGLQVPRTYEELKAMVPTLRAAGKEVILMGAQDDWVVQSTLFSMIVGRLVGDEGMDAILAGKARFTDEPFVKALEFYASLFEDGVLSRRIFQTGYNEVNPLFAQGKAPFLIDGDWKVRNFLTDPSTDEALIPPAEQKHIRMTIFPAIPGEVTHNSTSMVQGDGYGINAKIPTGSRKEEAAWRLVQWLTSTEAQRVRMETGSAFPSRKGVTSDRLEPLAQERSQFYGGLTGTYVLDNVLDPKVYVPINVGLQEIGLGISSPRQVAESVQKAFDAWKASQQ